MNKGTKTPRWHSPFDDSAGVRLRRMRLLQEDGAPDRKRVSVLGEVFAGQFFDDLYDFRQDAEAAGKSLGNFLKEAEGATAKYRFLLVCLQYDAIRRPLPDPVWWLSGNAQLADLFSTSFVAHLRELAKGVIQ